MSHLVNVPSSDYDTLHAHASSSACYISIDQVRAEASLLEFICGLIHNLALFICICLHTPPSLCRLALSPPCCLVFAVWCCNQITIALQEREKECPLFQLSAFGCVLNTIDPAPSIQVQDRRKVAQRDELPKCHLAPPTQIQASSRCQ